MRIAYSFSVCLALMLLTPSTASAHQIFFQVCEDYKSGEHRDCKVVESIEYSTLGSAVLYVYMELAWTPGQNRQHDDVFLRWLHRTPNGREEQLAFFPDSSAYRWEPSRRVNTTRWLIEITVWKDNPGSYVFQSYTDPADIDGSRLEEILVPVLAGDRSS